MTTPFDPAATLERNVDLVRKIAGVGAVRGGLSGTEVEDFSSWVLVRLVADDHSVLRKFEGRSSLKQFLSAVISHMLADYRNEVWGRWRASAAAKRFGPTGVRLERLVYRDRRPIREAIEVLRSEGVSEDNAELLRMLREIPAKWMNREVELAAAAESADESRADGALWNEQRAAALKHSVDALAVVLEALPAEDRAIVKLHYYEEWTVAEIARNLGLDQKALYRRLEALREQLKTALQACGVDREHVSCLMDAEATA